MAALIGITRGKGVSGYVGDGSNRWPAVHQLDAAHLFRLALENTPAGSVLHAVADEGVPIRAIAELIGRHLDLPLAAIPPPVDWVDLAGRAGYFDQAHFGHEFRTFTGLTPTRYVDVRRRFLREHPGHALDVGPLPAD